MSPRAPEVRNDHVLLLHQVDDLHLEVGERATERSDPSSRALRESAFGNLIQDIGVALVHSLLYEPVDEMLVRFHVHMEASDEL